MVELKYANAYAEVLEILKYVSKEDYNKIPKNKIEVLKNNYNKYFEIKYNPKKTLEEQNISEGGMVIIGLFFRDYWATSEQKNKIIAKQNYNRLKLEDKKRELYNPDNLFKNDNLYKDNISRYDKRTSNMQMIKYKDTFFSKIKKWIKNIFKAG